MKILPIEAHHLLITMTMLDANVLPKPQANIPVLGHFQSLPHRVFMQTALHEHANAAARCEVKTYFKGPHNY